MLPLAQSDLIEVLVALRQGLLLQMRADRQPLRRTSGAGELRDLFVAFPAEGTSVIVTEDSGGGVGVGVGAVVVAGVVGTGICSS